MKFENIPGILYAMLGKMRVYALKTLAIEGPKSIRQNFIAGGRPVAWKPRKRISKAQRNTNLMRISGALMNVTGIPTEDKVTLITDPRARAYAQIHNEGGVIHMPARELKFRKLNKVGGKGGGVRFASSSNKRIVKTVTSKPYTITIPQRRFMIIPEEDYPRICQVVASAIKPNL